MPQLSLLQQYLSFSRSFLGNLFSRYNVLAKSLFSRNFQWLVVMRYWLETFDGFAAFSAKLPLSPTFQVGVEVLGFLGAILSPPLEAMHCFFLSD